MRPLDAPDDAASGAATSPEGLAPRRLLDGGGTPFERLLVEPSRSGGVPRASLVRLAHALKLPPEALPAPSSEALPALPPETPLSRPPEGQPARGSRLARQASLARLGVVGLVVGAVAVVGVR
ncbi:MAG TPA: hypothetical protein VNN80_00265, partial [Polyangiaceae bacterium]|nr:hypothetical protein [Polyangiaceae bacterium]